VITTDQRTSAAALLLQAERLRQPTAPLSDQFPGLDVEDAYAIQLENIGAKLAEGRSIRGHKVGLSSKAMQDLVGVHEPDYGHLLDSMFVAAGAEIDLDTFLQPRIEPEIAFVLGAPLNGPGVTVEDVRAATSYVVAALELVDSRIVDWRIRIGDTIADNASSGAVVIGTEPQPLGATDLRAVPVTLQLNGEVVERGDGAAVLGDPAISVAWLANKVGPYGVVLEAGHVIMPGACTRMIPVAPGDVVTADFGSLGSVTAAFTGRGA
jgi:2-keto-4-pentenoate hydratase